MEPPQIRVATLDDVGPALEVAGAALGWDPSEPNESLFRWKHTENPAGPSPMWVAVDGEQVVGFRSMLRWRFTDGDEDRHAVRAVDTATHPDHHRRGIFTALTLRAVAELTSSGVDFVFNTPNARSRPGYLRMGWVDAGRLGVRLAPTSPGAAARLARSRTAAAKWSEPVTGGTDIEAVADDLADLLARLPRPRGLGTARTVDHLRWRYGFAPLHYRVVRDDEGLAVIRVRRRGRAREVVLAEMLAPDRGTARRLGCAIRREFDADNVLSLTNSPQCQPLAAPVPGLGPRLTLRTLASSPPDRGDLHLSLGDIELF